MKDNHRRLIVCILAMLFILIAAGTTASAVSEPQQMRDYLIKRDWQNAISRLDNLIKQSPSEASTFIIGDENEKLWGDKIGDAIEVLETAAQSAPKDDVGLKLKVALVDCYKHIDNWDQAFSLIETIASDYPDKQATYHNLKAICFYYQGKQTEALAEIKAAVDSYIGPANEKSLMNRLLGCYPYDDSNRIIRSIYAMLRYLPDCTDLQRVSVYKWAWQICMDAGRYEEANAVYACAAPCWEKMKAENPDDPQILSLLIHAYLDVKDYDRAIPLCKEIVARKPDMAINALTVLAECMYALGIGQEALAFQEDYYRQHPELSADADWLNARTVFYAEKNKQKAMLLFEKILKEHPNFRYKYELNSLLAYCYKASGQVSKEIGVLEEMLKRNATYTERIDISTKLAILYSSCDVAKAEKLLNQLIKNNPDHHLMPKWKFQMAFCSLGKGDLTTSSDAFKAIYEQYPDNEYGRKAQFWHADCCIRNGDKATGKAVLQEMVDKSDSNWSVIAANRLKMLAEN